MGESPDRRSNPIGLDAEYLTLKGLCDVTPVPVIVTRSANGCVIVDIHIAPRKVSVLPPVVRRRQGPDQWSDLSDVVKGTFDNIHLIPFVPSIGQVVVAQC